MFFATSTPNHVSSYDQVEQLISCSAFAGVGLGLELGYVDNDL